MSGRGMELIEAQVKRRREEQSEDADRRRGATRLKYAALAYVAANKELWPFDCALFKPVDPLTNLVKAGALFLAAAEVADLEEEAEDYRERAAEVGRDLDELSEQFARLWREPPGPVNPATLAEHVPWIDRISTGVGGCRCGRWDCSHEELESESNDERALEWARHVADEMRRS